MIHINFDVIKFQIVRIIYRLSALKQYHLSLIIVFIELYLFNLLQFKEWILLFIFQIMIIFMVNIMVLFYFLMFSIHFRVYCVPIEYFFQFFLSVLNDLILMFLIISQAVVQKKFASGIILYHIYLPSCTVTKFNLIIILLFKAFMTCQLIDNFESEIK